MQFRWLKRSMHDGSIEEDYERGRRFKERTGRESPHHLMMPNDGLVLSLPKSQLRP